jgi:hypothetical protein|tara:strand:+ start:115 stop:264 length:150 start_codon:yes stop_codon:yes gene_type:complete
MLDEERELGPITGLRAGLAGVMVLFLILLMIYYTFWPIVKIAIGFLPTL